MKVISTLAISFALCALAGCNNETPREQAADNIEANAEMRADNLEEMADNASTDATDATRRGMDADGNSAN